MHNLLCSHYLRADLREFAEHLLALGRTPCTARTYVYGLLRVERAQGKSIQQIDSKDTVALPPRRTVARYDRGDHRRGWAFHLFGVERGYWEMNGLMAVTSPKRVRKPSPWLPQEQARQLLAACATPFELRLCFLPLYAGCRISEAGAIGPAHRISDGRLSFEGKGHKWREVPIHPLLGTK